MFFKKKKQKLIDIGISKQQEPERWIGFHKESEEQQLIAEENAPGSVTGRIYFDWYIPDTKKPTKIYYGLASYDCHIEHNSVDYFRRFNRIATDIAAVLCKDYTTATLITYYAPQSNFTPEMH